MKKQDFQCEHLKQLPLRAIVAFSVRCARRVQSLSELPEGHPERERLREDVEAALRMAEGFASGSAAPIEDSVVEALDASRRVAGLPLGAGTAAAAASEAAHAAASAWHLTGSPDSRARTSSGAKAARHGNPSAVSRGSTADLAALNAFARGLWTAYQAVGLHNEDFAAAALNDYDALLRLKLGHYPEAGDPIDPSPAARWARSDGCRPDFPPGRTPMTVVRFVHDDTTTRDPGTTGRAVPRETPDEETGRANHRRVRTE